MWGTKRAKEDVTTELAQGKILPLVIRLTVPAVIAQLITFLYNIVDRMYVSRIAGSGMDALAALGIVLPITLIIQAFANLVGLGGSPRAGIKMGENNEREANRIFNTSLIAFLFAAVVWSISMAEPRIYATIFSASDQVTEIVAKYCPLFLMGSIMFFVQMTLQNINVALGQAKSALLLAVNRKVVILIPLCFALTHFLGFKGVYLSEGIADLVAGIITTVVIFITFPRIFREREEKVKGKL